jgi:hypothetical protein
MISTSSTMDHEKRVAILGALANLTGCKQRVSRLPDGRIPDVLQVNSESNALFIGDAKHTETPGNVETRIRLFGYLRWVALHSGRDRNSSAVFALAVGNPWHVPAWKEELHCLSREAGIGCIPIRELSLGQRIYIVWFAVATVSGLGSATDARSQSRTSSSLAFARIRAGFN